MMEEMAQRINRVFALALLFLFDMIPMMRIEMQIETQIRHIF